MEDCKGCKHNPKNYHTHNKCRMFTYHNIMWHRTCPVKEKRASMKGVEVTVGLLLRRKFRRMLTTLSNSLPTLSWTEEKGFLDSLFIIRGSLAEIEALKKIMIDIKRNM